jgi:hypothetical protein
MGVLASFYRVYLLTLAKAKALAKDYGLYFMSIIYWRISAKICVIPPKVGLPSEGGQASLYSFLYVLCN